MKNIILFVIFCLTTQLSIAQELSEPKLLSIFEIAQQQWISHDKDIDLEINLDVNKITLTRANELVVNGREKKVIAEITYKKIVINNKKIKLTTRKPTYPKGSNNIHFSKKEKAFLELLTNKKIQIEATNESLFIIEGDKHIIELYNENKHRLTSFLSKFDWRLIQLDGNSNLNTDVCIQFDFNQKSIIGEIDHSVFKSKLSLYSKENTVYLEPLQFADNSLPSKASLQQMAFVNKFENLIYQFDIAEQTLNFYKDDHLVMMFGLVKKED